MLKKLVTKFFQFSMLQTIDFSKETKMMMKFSRESFFRRMAPDYHCIINTQLTKKMLTCMYQTVIYDSFMWHSSQSQ